MTEITRILDRVELKIENEIAYVTLSRPDKLNALDMPMFEAITEVARTLAENKDLRAVILSGEGKAFCAGLDVQSMFSNPAAVPTLLVKEGENISNLAQDVSYLWRELPIPVVAVTHGNCLGGGLHIALGADFRYSTPDCKFSIMESRWGLIPDMAGSLTLRDLCRIDQIKEITMTAEKFDAVKADKLGIITYIYDDPMAEAIKFAEAIKDKSPDAIVSTKTLYNKVWNSSVAEALDWETKLQSELIGKPNQMTAIQRGMNPSSTAEYKPRK